jgi:hypothetical protein
MSILPDHDAQEMYDLEVQHTCADKILKCEKEQGLMGQEAPVYRCHTFFPANGGDTYAKMITRQLNHLAQSLGVLGFQVSYKEDSLDPKATRPDRGYFEVRVFAETPPKS